ncbi:carbohydrate ABC transporter permease [Egicoccus sp. AB-alg2]|uniref:carbohydrate ABC transporter permease n=1 Tax=Egicoccus sp. AB-alg2 TaxID=3242693 RepID=UPI00359CE2DA
MTSTTTPAPAGAAAAAADAGPSRRRRRLETATPVLMVLPSILAIGVFVYGFIAWTGWVSVSNWTTFVRDLSFNGFGAYTRLFGDFRFLSGLRNVVVFTVLFVGVCLVVGLVLAMIIDRDPFGAPVWRNLFLFPVALSFVVTGVVWQWLLNPRAGVNLLLNRFGWEDLPLWYVSTTIVPGWRWGQIDVVVPVALIAVVIAAAWQMSGFAMAIYLAGLQGIPDELREAARMDGASEIAVYRRVLLPMLRPMTITIIIVLGHISLKTFDLIYVMTGPGTGYVTDVPAVYMYETTFRGNQFARGAAISLLLLGLVALLMVPALWARRRTEEALG